MYRLILYLFGLEIFRKDSFLFQAIARIYKFSAHHRFITLTIFSGDSHSMQTLP